MRYGFGIDVGGTTVKLGLFTESGELLEKWEIPTNTADSGSAILPDIATAITGALSRHGIARETVLGVGLGVPGPVDSRGVVDHCVNLGWPVVDLPEALGKLTGLPVAAANDANVAALGECWKGGGQGHRSMVLATLGTGIGGGIVIDGKMVCGAHGAGGEIGHIPMEWDDPETCGCGKRGCAEQYGSATGISRMAKKAMEESDKPSVLRQLPQVTARDIFAMGAIGDELAQEILERYYRFLARFLAAVCCVVDPEIVVLGGGVSKAGAPLLAGIQKYFNRYVFHACNTVEFALARLGNDAGIYGSFKLALDSFGGTDERK